MTTENELLMALYGGGGQQIPSGNTGMGSIFANPMLGLGLGLIGSAGNIGRPGYQGNPLQDAFQMALMSSRLGQDERRLGLSEKRINQDIQQNSSEGVRAQILNRARAQAEAAQQFPTALGAPSGYVTTDTGGLAPRPVEGVPGVNNYADLQMALAAQRAMIPGYGEQERLGMQAQAADRDMQRLQMQQMNMELQQMQRERQSAQQAEQLRLSQESSNRQQEQFEFSKRATVPSKVHTDYETNMSLVNQIDNAIKLAQERPESFGLKRALGEDINQRVDPAGVPYRGAIADLGSAQLHERSGTAQTLTEIKRLRPFVPDVYDSPEAVQEKLKTLRNKVLDENRYFYKYFGTKKWKNPVPSPDELMVTEPNAGGAEGEWIEEKSPSGLPMRRKSR